MGDTLNNNEIAEMFKNQNSRIFSENVLRNIDDNDSSLRLTVSNRISLISNETVRRINDLLKNSGTEYDFKSLHELFSKYSDSLIEYSNGFLDDRKDSLLSSFSSDSTSIDGIISTADSFLKSKKDEFERGVNDIIYLQLEEELISTFHFNNEQQQQDVVACLSKYDSKVTNAVETSITERNASLKNTVLETSKKVESLNNKATDYSSSVDKVR